MNSILEYYTQAKLSFAAYADLSGLASTYPAALEAAGMSPTQAADFASKWSVIDQYTDPASGFSATVFERGGRRYLAIRGTQPGDMLDWIADFDLAAVNGVAAKQTISLFNYVQRLKGATGQPVAQLEWNGQDYVLNPTGAVGLLDTPLTGPITIAGHSLGGHLAMAFGRLFPQDASQIYTYNAPGFLDTAADGFFARVDAALGRAGSVFSDAKTVNLYGDGLSVIAGYANDHGAPQGIFLENNTHNIVSLTDSLAVYALFAQIDPALNSDGLGTVADILKASTNVAENSLEAALAAIGKIYGKTYGGIETSRDDLYTHLYALQAAITDTGTGTVVAINGDVAGQAQSDIAYRYALVNLNPFAITGNDALYAPHNANGELDIYDSSTGTGTLTELYLQDRAAMLAWKIKYDSGARDDDGLADDLFRIGDKPYSADWDSGKIQEDWEFTDVSRSITLAIDGVGAKVHRIAFGDSLDNSLTGGDAFDHFYGGAGNDALAGGAGDDHLEGQAGDDILNGDDGRDTLIGGTGADSLEGGAQSDRLEGGQGADTYIIRAADGIYGGNDDDMIFGDFNWDEYGLTPTADQAAHMRPRSARLKPRMGRNGQMTGIA